MESIIDQYRGTHDIWNCSLPHTMANSDMGIRLDEYSRDFSRKFFTGVQARLMFVDLAEEVVKTLDLQVKCRFFFRNIVVIALPVLTLTYVTHVKTSQQNVTHLLCSAPMYMVQPQ
jgi:hypothetical protein